MEAISKLECSGNRLQVWFRILSIRSTRSQQQWEPSSLSTVRVRHVEYKHGAHGYMGMDLELAVFREPG
jgi:hypothetical protein